MAGEGQEEVAAREEDNGGMRRRKIWRDRLGRVSRRDEHGRFAPKLVPLRDDQGKFVPGPSRPAREISRPVSPGPRKKPAPRPAPRKKPLPLPRRRPAPRPAPRKKKRPAPRPVSKKKKLPRKRPVPAKKKKHLRKKSTKKKLPGRPRRPELPLVAEASRLAEQEMQARLLALLDSIGAIEGGLSMTVQTFVNRDGTVDGELRIGHLPDEWRIPGGAALLVSTLSNAIRAITVFASKPSMGGTYWASFGIRFGPQNEAEVGEMVDLYKRYRGMFQIGTYPTPAWGQGALQVALTGDTVGLRAMLNSLMKKRGLSPSVILIRFIWTPDNKRPAHYRGEKGEK